MSNNNPGLHITDPTKPFTNEEIFQLSNDAIVVINGEGTILDGNIRAIELFGYSLEELCGMPVFNLHPEQDHEKSRAMFDLLLEKQYQRFYINILTKNDELREVEVSASFTKKADEIVILSIIRDYTSENKAKREINRLSQFPEQNPNPVIRVDNQYRLEYANQASKALLSRLDVKIGDKLPPDWQEKVAVLCENAGCKNKLKNFEYYLNSHYYLFTLSSIDETGQIYIYGQDITQLKEYEQKLESTNQELNTFIYKTHHDLKNPLSSLLGVVDLAKDDVSDEDALFYIQMISESAYKLDSIMDNLIKVIKIKDNQFNMEEVDMKALAGEVQNEIGTHPGYEKVNFYWDFDTDPVIYSSKAVLNSILENLMGNGIKYRDENKAENWIRIALSKNGDHVLLRIADNGIGLEHQYLDKIFDMFYRATAKRKGTGLGLYLVKKGVEKLKGRIEVDSQKDIGTEFRITLPINNEQVH